MHNSIAKFIKYLLWTLLGVVFVFLLFGLSKSNRNISTYISLLNQTNLSDFKGISVFQTKSYNTGDIIVEDSTGKLEKSGFQDVQEDKEEGLDVYDPQFEQDMQDVSIDSILSGEEEGYGFKQETTTTTNATVSTKTGALDAQQKLIELINKNEMKK